jgi:hypothetical protein
VHLSPVFVEAEIVMGNLKRFKSMLVKFQQSQWNRDTEYYIPRNKFLYSIQNEEEYLRNSENLFYFFMYRAMKLTSESWGIKLLTISCFFFFWLVP